MAPNVRVTFTLQYVFCARDVIWNNGITAVRITYPCIHKRVTRHSFFSDYLQKRLVAAYFWGNFSVNITVLA